MAIALVTSVSQGGAGASSGVDTTGATLLVAGCSAQTISAGLSDNKSNTWTQIGTTLTQPGAFNQQVAFYYVNGTPIVGPGHTFTCGDVTPAVAMLAFNATAITSALDQSSQAADQSSPAQAGSITPGVDNEVLVFLCGGFNGTGGSVDLGFTLQENVLGDAGSNYSIDLSYLVETTAAAKNPGLTYDNVRSQGCFLSSFKAAGGGGATSPFPPFEHHTQTVWRM